MKGWLEFFYHISGLICSPLILLRVVAACLTKANDWAKDIIDKKIGI